MFRCTLPLFTLPVPATSPPGLPSVLALVALPSQFLPEALAVRATVQLAQPDWRDGPSFRTRPDAAVTLLLLLARSLAGMELAAAAAARGWMVALEGGERAQAPDPFALWAALV